MPRSDSQFTFLKHTPFMPTVLGELRRAMEVGGTPRRSGSPVERSCLKVTRTTRRTITDALISVEGVVGAGTGLGHRSCPHRDGVDAHVGGRRGPLRPQSVGSPRTAHELHGRLDIPGSRNHPRGRRVMERRAVSAGMDRATAAVARRRYRHRSHLLVIRADGVQ